VRHHPGGLLHARPAGSDLYRRGWQQTGSGHAAPRYSGSLERFIGILIEEHAGALPTWLAPVQAVILTITDEQQEAALRLEKTLRRLGWRVESDLRNEKIGFKIREHTLQRIPYMLIVGKKEALEGTLAVRTRKGEDLGGMTSDAFHVMLTRETASRGVTILEDQKHRDG